MKNQKILRNIYDAALKSVDPAACVKKHIDYVRQTYEETGFERLFVVAFGKAAYAMCKAVEESIGDLINEGVAVTKYDHGGELERIKVLEASHPLPDENGIQAGWEIADLLENAGDDTLVLCLISGGGSSLLVSPCDTLTLEDQQKTTDLLLKAGAEISEINCVRKHISKVKGGRLAEIASPASVISLILSDVVGDSLDVIASGPTAPDTSSFKEAMNVMGKYQLRGQAPPAVLNYLSAGALGLVAETPKAENDVFCRVKNTVIGSNALALEGAKEKAEALGFVTEILTDSLFGDAGEIAIKMADFALEKKKSSPDSPLCYISGGETTVNVTGKGKGGRNMELALTFAEKIKGSEGITLLSAGTDGTDGSTDAAGAIVDGETVEMAESDGFMAQSYIENNDSYRFFKNIDGLLITGPTGTNVMDVQILIVE